MTWKWAVRPAALAGAATLVVALALAGCGDDAGAKCGNGKVEGTEQCDDGTLATGACSSECTWQEWNPDSSGSGSAMFPAVAMNEAGQYVVVWRAADESMDENIWATVYDSNGEAMGPSFQVNTNAAGYQQYPEVAMDGEGNFVIVWQNDPSSPGADNDDVWMRAFEADGTPRGPDVQMNIWSDGWQSKPNVAMNADGEMVVVWSSDGQDGDLTGVFARLGDSTGQLAAEPFQANTTTENAQENAWPGVSPDGSFVIVWEATGQEST